MISAIDLAPQLIDAFNRIGTTYILFTEELEKTVRCWNEFKQKFNMCKSNNYRKMHGLPMRRRYRKH